MHACMHACTHVASVQIVVEIELVGSGVLTGMKFINKLGLLWLTADGYIYIYIYKYNIGSRMHVFKLSPARLISSVTLTDASRLYN